jgi:hypothetical protein
MEHLNSEMGTPTRTAKSGTVAKTQGTRALQQRIQRKKDISSITGSVSYSK